MHILRPALTSSWRPFGPLDFVLRAQAVGPTPPTHQKIQFLLENIEVSTVSFALAPV